MCWGQLTNIRGRNVRASKGRSDASRIIDDSFLLLSNAKVVDGKRIGNDAADGAGVFIIRDCSEFRVIPRSMPVRAISRNSSGANTAKASELHVLRTKGK